MDIDLGKLKKLSDLGKAVSLPASAALGSLESLGTMTAVIRVTDSSYVPPQVRVRARIAPTLFTADFPAAALPALEQDPKVSSIDPPRRQQLAE